MPEARETARCPSASNSWSSTTSLKPQAQNLSACSRKFKLSSRNRSCSCRCCGVRKVPLVQSTGCSCFMGYLNAANKDKGSCLNHNLYSRGVRQAHCRSLGFAWDDKGEGSGSIDSGCRTEAFF